MKNLPSEKKQKRGGKIDVHAYIAPEVYDELAKYRNVDDGDRWESALLRKVIREWLEMQRGTGSGSSSGGESEGDRGPLRDGLRGKSSQLKRERPESV